MAHEKILLVDDDVNFVKALTIRLKANGYKVVVAFDGVGAMGAVRKEEPDLVLLDVLLPGGDGMTIFKRINQLAASCGTPVIFITAKGDMETEVDAMVEGAAGYLRKPFDSEKLLLLIRETLDKKPA